MARGILRAANTAATTIQTAYRDHRNRRRRTAATKIQALFRGAKARKAFREIRSAATNAFREMRSATANAPSTPTRSSARTRRNNSNSNSNNRRRNTTANRRAVTLVNNMRPEARVALRTNNRNSNRNLETLAVANAQRRFPGVNWAVITRDQIRPLVNRIGGELSKPNNQKAVFTVMMMLVALFLFQIDPAFMTVHQKQTLRQLEGLIPGMIAPISNTNASPWKRMISLAISKLYPSQERFMYEAAVGNIPAWAFNNKYKRTVYGFMLQYMALFLSLLLARIPWSRKGYTKKAIIAILSFGLTLNTTLGSVMFSLYFKEKVAITKITTNMFLQSIKLVAAGTGGAIGGPAGAGAAGVGAHVLLSLRGRN